jgi:hypothetical protein
MPENPKLLAAQLGVVLATCIASAALAVPSGPPPQAFAACAAKAQGDKCTVQRHQHQRDGTCAAFGEKLACKPDHRPGGPPGPPPETQAP